jgi:hypothetical protein
MTRRTFAILFFAVLISFPLSADDYTMTPTSGPSTGGTTVTIKGEFGTWPYTVFFGGVPAASTQRVDSSTLVAISPEHLPGPSHVEIFEYDIFLTTNLIFTFTGDVPASYERVLLPILLPPVTGQGNSQFVTSFTAHLTEGERASFYGLAAACQFVCPPLGTRDVPLVLTPSGRRLTTGDLDLNGNPGRFFFIPKSEIDNVSMNLRVFDTSRSTQNFGTEIPIIRESRMRDGYDGITLLNVPTSPLFRNTLRIYATFATTVTVVIEPPWSNPAPPIAPLTYTVDLVAGENLFEPASATFTQFPLNSGLQTVSIYVENPPILPPAAPKIWAFVSTTNNDTQLITTITPQP